MFTSRVSMATVTKQRASEHDAERKIFIHKICSSIFPGQNLKFIYFSNKCLGTAPCGRALIFRGNKSWRLATVRLRHSTILPTSGASPWRRLLRRAPSIRRPLCRSVVTSRLPEPLLFALCLIKSATRIRFALFSFPFQCFIKIVEILCVCVCHSAISTFPSAMHTERCDECACCVLTGSTNDDVGSHPRRLRFAPLSACTRNAMCVFD